MKAQIKVGKQGSSVLAKITKKGMLFTGVGSPDAGNETEN